MKHKKIIEEVIENLKDLPIAFRYLKPLVNYNKDFPEKDTVQDNITTYKPLEIKKYQTPTYLHEGGYFKPVSRCFLYKPDDKNS